MLRRLAFPATESGQAVQTRPLLLGLGPEMFWERRLSGVDCNHEGLHGADGIFYRSFGRGLEGHRCPLIHFFNGLSTIPDRVSNVAEELQTPIPAAEAGRKTKFASWFASSGAGSCKRRSSSHFPS